MDFTIKPLTTNEQPLMGDFLYLSIHQEPGADPVPKLIIEKEVRTESWTKIRQE